MYASKFKEFHWSLSLKKYIQEHIYIVVIFSEPDCVTLLFILKKKILTSDTEVYNELDVGVCVCVFVWLWWDHEEE